MENMNTTVEKRYEQAIYRKIQMTIKYMKWYSTPLIVKEMQTETIKYSISPGMSMV